MANIIEKQRFDAERALYHLQDAQVVDCDFAGPADGESVLKECRHIEVRGCRFSLRYPLWHAEHFTLRGSTMDAATRAPIWYAKDGLMEDTQVDGIKCLRECDGITLRRCALHSPEFGWKCRGVTMEDCAAESEYFLFESSNVQIDRLRMQGKYSFQYMQNVQIRRSTLDTKDAFWHSRNVTVEDSVVKGEYLGWYSEGLTLVRCHIIGTQPLCYCRGLRLIDCTMEGTDLSFEYSEVDADIKGEILSVKNPKSGRIVADKIGEVIWEDSILDSTCDVRERG